MFVREPSANSEAPPRNRQDDDLAYQAVLNGNGMVGMLSLCILYGLLMEKYLGAVLNIVHQKDQLL